MQGKTHPTTVQDTPEDTRCRCCGAADAPLRQIWQGGQGYVSRRWCLNEVECTRQQDAEAAVMDRRYVLTDAGREALALILQGEQLRLEVVS